LGEWLVLVEALGSAGVGQSVLGKVALLTCRGEGEVDPLPGAAELVDAFGELPVSSNVGCDPPVIDFFRTVCEYFGNGCCLLGGW